MGYVQGDDLAVERQHATDHPELRCGPLVQAAVQKLSHIRCDGEWVQLTTGSWLALDSMANGREVVAVVATVILTK
jgi:hypothetical protein